MAVYKSIASGNFTSASTWGLVNAASFQDTGGTGQNLTTSVLASASFVPGAITVDGILVKVSTISGTIAGTITAELYNSTDSASVGSRTINGSDLNAAGSIASSGGWYYFKFASTHLLIAGKSYVVRLNRSSVATGTVTMLRTATANDWNRGLVTTTTANPGAGDTLIIAGEQTGAGTYNSFTVTMDNTSTTSFGPVYINNNSILNYGTSASTNYYLKLAGNLIIYAGGVFQMGTSGTSMPSGSTASLEFACGSIAQYGATNYGTFTTYGASKTISAKLNADVSAAATSITTDVSTGWKSGDTIVIAGTTTTQTQYDRVTLAVDASGTSVTVPALTNLHGGNSTTGIQADIININRNVKIFASSISFPTYLGMPNLASTTSLYYTEFYNWGSNTGSTTSGLAFNSNSGVLDVRYCSFYDATLAGGSYMILLSNNASSGSINIISNTFHNHLVGTSVLDAIRINSASSGTWTINANIFVYAGSPYLADVGGTFTNNIFANGTGLRIQEGAQLGTFSGNTFYGCSNAGFVLNANAFGSISNSTIWRLATGISVGAGPGLGLQMIFDGGTIFSCTNGVNASNGSVVGQVIIKDYIIKNGTNGMFTNGQGDGILFLNCAFSGNSTGDVGNINYTGSISFVNCTFASTTECYSQSSMINKFYGLGTYSLKHQGISGNYKSWGRFGTIQRDTTIYKSASPSMRMVPINASSKLQQIPIKLAVKSGDTATVSVGIRKSVSGDGTAYNGNQPRLMLRVNLLGGIASDTVLATASGAAGSWETLIGTTAAVTQDCVLEFYIDCDGTLGWVNVDDWTTAYYANTANGNFMFAGNPFVELDATPKERSFTFSS